MTLLRPSILLTLAVAAPAVWCGACPCISAPDRQKAVSEAAWLSKSCELGYAADCNELSMLYAGGRKLPRDEARAAELYRKACDRGHTDGCFKLGGLYEQGRAMAKDEARAAELSSTG
ncbi:tetratricopeptide repeat protein [Sorangium sp. So ce1099]|uniref:tetratricopeptide repeat protein n=1 Tax=Sorangium sp. So ce1099 TaxID=3133331 RepID=UPI003F5F1800